VIASRSTKVRQQVRRDRDELVSVLLVGLGSLRDALEALFECEERARPKPLGDEWRDLLAAVDRVLEGSRTP
jgi:hypothetical protein